MVSANLTQKPNAPIFLEGTIITHIVGQRLLIPCSGRVTLHLSPRILCLIDSDNPRWLDKFQGKTLLVTFENGCMIKMLLSLELNDLFVKITQMIPLRPVGRVGVA